MTQHDAPPANPKALAEQIVNTERQAAACQQGAYSRLVEELNEVNKLGKGVSNNVFTIVAETDRHDSKPSMVAETKDATLVISDPFKMQQARHDATVGTWLEGHDAKVDAQNWNRSMHVTTQLYEDFQKAYYSGGDAGVRRFADEINLQNTSSERFSVTTDNGVTKVLVGGHGVNASEICEYSPETIWHIPTPTLAETGAAAAAAGVLKPATRTAEQLKAGSYEAQPIPQSH